MADLQSVKDTLQLVAEFIDGDTRSIALDNPKDSLTAEEIDSTNAIMVKCLVGDKEGAQFYRWKTAAKVNKITTLLDIGS